MKERIGIIALTFFSPLLYNVVSFLTILVLWMFFGESSDGSEKAIQTQNRLFVYHLPILSIISLLAYLTIKNRRKNKKVLVTGGLTSLISILVYVFMESFRGIIR